MSSIIEGYNYDIFISYRQKDNKGDKWVSEFVEALKMELESTFKEEISVYFDINPHDGLLETHDVDESLKEKLKCLIFIPIISRTYCDPKAFAWEHEFKAFVEQASKDEFGLKVRLPNGNVASRVLPVIIYDLDNEDIQLCESVLAGILRGVEFVYAERGVNRPLKPDDDEKINLNKTKYRNQINKIANSIKEITQGVKATSAPGLKEKAVISKDTLEEVRKEERKETSKKSVKLSKLLSTVVIAAILIVAAILVYPKIFKRDRLEFIKSKGEISVAVLPFQNMTNDTSKNFWQMMIQDNLITSLSNSEELKVRQFESIVGILQNDNLTNYASITPTIASNVSQRLDANVFVHGSINQIGSTIRLNARLFDSETEEVYQSFQLEGTEENILHLTDSLSKLVNNFLIIDLLEKQVPQDMQQWLTTNSPEAYRCYINGLKAHLQINWTAARDWYLQALEIDSNIFMGYMSIAFSYEHTGMYNEAINWALKLYNKKDQLPSNQLKIMADYLYAYYFETPNEEAYFLKQAVEFDDQSPAMHWQLGETYTRIDQHDKAIIEYERTLELFEKWNIKPFWILCYTYLGIEYHATGQFKKEKKLYKQAERDFPDSRFLRQQAILALSTGKTKAANEYIGEFITILKDNSASEADIASGLASIHAQAENLEKAEEYYRQALSLTPENPPGLLNAFAYFLIDLDRNVVEGLELVERALESQPENYNFLDTKGWGLYKQGKYQEALQILQKSWENRREKEKYNHQAYLHLEEARKAVID